MNLHSPTSSMDVQLLNERRLLWNGLFSTQKLDLAHAFQRVNKSPTEALVDYDPEANVQLVSVSRDTFPKKNQSFPSLNFYQTFSSHLNSPPISSLVSSPSERKQTPQMPSQSPVQTQSNFFLTNRSNAFSHRVLKPKKSKHNFTLQLSQIDRSTTIPSSSKLRSLVQTPQTPYIPHIAQTQPTERVPTSFLTIRGLSGNESVVKTPRVNVKSNKSYRVKSKMAPVVIPRKETVETMGTGEVKLTQLTERRMNLLMKNERQRSAMFKLSDILETDPTKLAAISKKYLNPTGS